MKKTQLVNKQTKQLKTPTITPELQQTIQEIQDQPPEDNPIPQDPAVTAEEFEITENELNRIFFGSEEVTPPESGQVSAKEEDVEAIGQYSDGSDKVKIDPISISDNNIVTKTTIEEKPIEEKKPRGRPIKWTPEKKAALKAERKRLAKLKRERDSEKNKLSRIANNQPITDYERQKITESNIKSKDDIEKHINEKRTKLKETQTINSVPFVRTKDVCNNHLLRMSYPKDGFYIVCCNSCSREEKMTPIEWKQHLSRNKGKI